MRDVYRLSLFAILASCTLIFVVVPLSILFLGFEEQIYPRGEVNLSLLALNLIILLPVFLLYLYFDADRRRPWLVTESALPWGVPLAIVLVWCLAFLLSGGLTYRLSDLLEGYASRGAVLQLLLSLTNAIIILASSLALYPKEGPARDFPRTLGILALALCFILSGSRGLLLQLLLTVWIACYLSRVYAGSGSDLPLKAGASKIRRERRPPFITLQAFMIAVMCLVILGLWGSLRDEQDEVMFFSLWRAAEPYWHHAYVNYVQEGVDFSVFYDSLIRIASLAGRWIGLEYDYSIDGAETILEDRLGIPFVEGISLPITFVGEGMLMAGHLGAAIYLALALILVLVSLYLTQLIPLRSHPLFLAILAYQVVKCFFLYPKSLSGVFLVMFYETARDVIILMILTLPFYYRAYFERFDFADRHT